ncbi:MAG: hypothetical protein M5U34_17260 [Chloroflexi bacterium]|nr:hypothetical protein [Chloroflexota bacterium]
MMCRVRTAFCAPANGRLAIAFARRIRYSRNGTSAGVGTVEFDPAVGLSAGLLIRGRDVLLTLPGLW